jgi:hypothetical protein
MIYFNTELLNLILNDKKTGSRMEFKEKNSLYGHFWSKKHFFDFFQKTTFSTFLIFFLNSKDGTHVLIELLVKLNADSEFSGPFLCRNSFWGVLPMFIVVYHRNTYDL